MRLGNATQDPLCTARSFFMHSQIPTNTSQKFEASTVHFQLPTDTIPLFLQDTTRNSYIFQQCMFVERREELGSQAMGIISVPPAATDICQCGEDPCSFFLQ